MPHQDFQPVALPDKRETPQLSLRGQDYEKLPEYSDVSADINTRIWPLRPGGACAVGMRTSRRSHHLIWLRFCFGFAQILAKLRLCSAPTGRASLSLLWVLGLPLVPGTKEGGGLTLFPQLAQGFQWAPGRGLLQISPPRGPGSCLQAAPPAARRPGGLGPVAAWFSGGQRGARGEWRVSC